MKYLKLFAIAFMMLFLTSCDDEINSITSAVVNNEGHLILTYEDGTILDQGLVIPEVDEIEIEYHLVNFYNTEGYIISTQIVEHEEAAFAPSLTIPDHLIFDMWDQSFDSITDDMNIHPVVQEKVFTISFHNPEVSVPDMTGIQYGESVTLPNPQVDGKEFLGWFVDENPYAPMASMYGEIHSDMELYARYEDILYTVTLHIDGDIETHTAEFDYGTSIGLSNIFTKEDYFFNGWYRYPNEIGPLGEEIEITEDINIYASWIQFEYIFIDSPDIPNDELIMITGVVGEHNYVHIPSEIDGEIVKRIGSQAFQYEPFLQVYLPDTITSLYNYSFSGMPNLETIVIPDSITYIGDGAFKDSTALFDVTLSSNLSNIRGRSFENTAIEEIVLPEGIEYIGYYAFYNTPLTTINIPSSVTAIGDYALSGTLITEFLIPEGVTHVHSYAFRDCPNLTTVSLPESLTYIGYNPFRGASSLHTVTLHEDNASFELIDDVIYSEALDKLFVYLPYKTDLSYTVLESILHAERWSITGNPYLETIILPDTMQNYYITETFEDMESLSSIEVYDAPGTAILASHNGVLYSADSTILYRYPQGKTDLTYTLHTSTQRVFPRAFKDNISINSVILNDGITHIQDYAFQNCTNLSAINFPSSLQYLYNGAFQNVDGITNITLPNTILSIGGYAFSEMDNLETLVLSESIFYLPYYMISNSNNITTLHIPASINNLSTEALVNSNGLSSLTIDPANTTFNIYNNTLYSEDYTTLYLVPGGYSNDLFYMHSETINVFAHFGSAPNIEIIQAHYNVLSFNSTVSNLPNLKGISFYNTTSITYLNTFPFDPNIDEGFNLYVRTALYEDYLENSAWAMFEDWIVPFN